MTSDVIVVVGTDTGVGKTLVCAGLGRALARRGLGVVAIKPVETGCGAWGEEGEDGALIAASTGQSEPRAALLRLRTPVAPAQAADLEGVEIDFDALIARVAAYAAGADVALVEGAGGLLSPLTWRHTIVDVARALGARALVVAADRLGTINHTLLTLDALAGAGVPVLGVALSAPPSPDASTGSNAVAIARLSTVDRIVQIPRVADVEAAAEFLDPFAEARS